MVVKFELDGLSVMGLNGGPAFKINPSISLFVTCETLEEIVSLWDSLIEGGHAMMPLDKYPWSEKYGWVVDKYGMTWQLMFIKNTGNEKKIIPSFLFVGSQFGHAERAIKKYVSVFKNSLIREINLYEPGEDQPEGSLKFGTFSLNGNIFAAMDGFGNHDFEFNEAVSLVVECENQEEIDFYWNKLTEGGKESMCGWLKDEFGVSWQIVPKNLGKLLSDPENGQKAMEALMKMKKLEIDKLQSPKD
jgi:predicted 3-demethylubiquinone-9 3-methyltransferase (glyoxalase superfamily)